MPSYADIGKLSKDLLLGTSKSGAFIYEPRVSFASTTSTGVSFATSAIKRADHVDGVVKVSYATTTYGADATFDPTGKVTVAGLLSDVKLSGLKISGAAVLGDPSSAKLGLDYAPTKELALKTSVALVSAPVVDVSAAFEYNGILIGGETAYSTAKSNITKYNLAAGYHTADFQVAAYITDLTIARVAYTHNVSPTTTVGAEVTRNLNAGATSFTLGYARKLANGALAKLKLDNTGLLSSVYETRLASGEKIAGSLQLQATDLSKPAKYGFALDLS